LSIEGAIKVLNDLVRHKLLESYALGGAMGAAFYMEPMVTYDLDVLCTMPGAADASALIDLGPLYANLKGRGHLPKAEHVVIEGIPVQFLPAHSALLKEAVAKAAAKKVGASRTRVITPEFLIAIMLSVGRAKDKLRAAAMLEQAALDDEALKKIIARHGLSAQWKTLQAMRKP